MTVKAQIKWTEGMQFIARAGNGPAVVFDSSDGGSGPSPMALVLIGVAGCSAIDVILIMKKKRAQNQDREWNDPSRTATGERSKWIRNQVGEGGLEPPRVLPHRNLNPARLPIPPLARGGEDGITSRELII